MVLSPTWPVARGAGQSWIRLPPPPGPERDGRRLVWFPAARPTGLTVRALRRSGHYVDRCGPGRLVLQASAGGRAALRARGAQGAVRTRTLSLDSRPSKPWPEAEKTTILAGFASPCQARTATRDGRARRR